MCTCKLFGKLRLSYWLLQFCSSLKNFLVLFSTNSTQILWLPVQLDCKLYFVFHTLARHISFYLLCFQKRAGNMASIKNTKNWCDCLKRNFKEWFTTNGFLSILIKICFITFPMCRSLVCCIDRRSMLKSEVEYFERSFRSTRDVPSRASFWS